MSDEFAEIAEHISLAVLNLVTALVAWRAGRRRSNEGDTDGTDDL